MATLQVRSLDDRLYRALGARAVRDNRSISQEVNTILQEYLSRSRPRHEDATAQFLQLCGTWQDERSEKAIAVELRRARRRRPGRFSRGL